jgi:DNA-binding IclR family transcriptional regulator
MTPLEAAVASGQVDTVQFLQHHGARMDAATAAGLICLATLQEDEEMSAYLKEQAPPALALDCDHVRLPWTD